jgi:ferrous iron transport protein A
MTLYELEKGETGIVIDLIQNEFTLKLVEMGIYKGRSITPVEFTFSKDPICVSVSDSRLMLRREEAKSIIVTKCDL